MPEWGLGITNVIARPSPGIDDLRPPEYLEGWRILEAKLREFKPQILVFVGVTLYRALAKELGDVAGAAIRPGFQRPTSPWRTNLRAPESQRAKRELQLCGNVERVQGVATRHRAIGQCAAIGPPPRGRFIRRISGISSRKIPPSSRNSWTNDTIDACCCTIPNSAP